MTFRPSEASGSRDPFSAAFATWSRSVFAPFTAGFGNVYAPFGGTAGVDPTAPLRAALELQRAVLETWLGLMTMPFTIVGDRLATDAKTPAAAPEPPARSETPAPPTPALIEAAPARVALAPPSPVVPAPPAAATPQSRPEAAPAPTPPPDIDPAGLFDDALVTKTAPPTLAAPVGEPDDLQAIKGIGPRLKQLLNDIGIYHYRQIAAWTPGEIAWMNAKIDFKGRVQRERWVAQARALANS
jgi:predicted flap endonuclease-1-like 5' DNA nuclease